MIQFERISEAEKVKKRAHEGKNNKRASGWDTNSSGDHCLWSGSHPQVAKPSQPCAGQTGRKTDLATLEFLPGTSGQCLYAWTSKNKPQQELVWRKRSPDYLRGLFTRLYLRFKANRCGISNQGQNRRCDFWTRWKPPKQKTILEMIWPHEQRLPQTTPASARTYWSAADCVSQIWA